MSRLMEVTHLPLFKILAYIDFGQGEFVLPPPCMNGEMEEETHVFQTSLNQMCFAAHVWRPPCLNGLRGRRVTSD